jgi:hypothetical protein
MFDSINLQSAISDIYDTGVDEDQLVLLYNANKEINMAVKTANRFSDRQIVSDIVLQGDTFSSILTSVQVDKIGQDRMEAGHFYLYKNILPVGFLGLEDDIVGITEAGHKAQQLNSFKCCSLGLQSANRCWLVRALTISLTINCKLIIGK